MKYIAIIVLALIILRIDMFVGVIERAWEKIPKKSPNTSTESFEVPSSVATLSVADVQENQANQLELLLAEFVYNPNRSTRDLIQEFLKKNATNVELNSQNLYRSLDSWRTLLVSENPEVPLLLNDLMNFFKGENFKIVQQFYSNYLDINPEFFFHYYPVKKDPNCIIARYAWNQSNRIEQDLLDSRQSKIEELNEKIEAGKIEFSKNCLLVIRVESNKTTQALDTP